MWRIEWSQTALRELYGFEVEVIERIISKLEEAAGDPTHFFTRLVGRDEYKLRIGDYRLIAFIIHEDETIFVRNVRHRKNIYR
jgi:mRNA interferase RelE/StbE